LTGGTGTSGASGASDGYFYFFLTFPYGQAFKLLNVSDLRMIFDALFVQILHQRHIYLQRKG